MNARQYRDALETLGLSVRAASDWLGVSEKTGRQYASDGASPPSARAIQMLLDMPDHARRHALAAPHPYARR